MSIDIGISKVDELAINGARQRHHVTLTYVYHVTGRDIT